MDNITKYCNNKNCTMVNPQPIDCFYKAPFSKDRTTHNCKTCIIIKRATSERKKRKSPIREPVIPNRNDPKAIRYSEWGTKKGTNRVTAIERSFRTPRWVNISDIKFIYDNCPRFYNVDHIIPLIHPLVCGLDVPWNMQYLKKSENSKKSNKFDETYNNTSWKVKRLKNEK